MARSELRAGFHRRGRDPACSARFLAFGCSCLGLLWARGRRGRAAIRIRCASSIPRWRFGSRRYDRGCTTAAGHCRIGRRCRKRHSGRRQPGTGQRHHRRRLGHCYRHRRSGRFGCRRARNVGLRFGCGPGVRLRQILPQRLRIRRCRRWHRSCHRRARSGCSRATRVLAGHRCRLACLGLAVGGAHRWHARDSRTARARLGSCGRTSGSNRHSRRTR